MGHKDFLTAYAEYGCTLKASDKSGFALVDCSQIDGFYVYALIDPRNNEIFYIGKGKGLRWQQHGKEPLKNSKKWLRINDIRQAGKEYRSIYLATGLTNAKARLIELDCIRQIGFKRLANIRPGEIDALVRTALMSTMAMRQIAKHPKGYWRDKLIADLAWVALMTHKQIEGHKNAVPQE